MQPAPPSAAAVFGERLRLAERFHASLCEAGPIRGLNGPREVPVLWERHLINSALLAYLPDRVLPDGASVCDVGSGGGLPGIPLAIARPDLQITLVDPLQRRISYLEQIVGELALENVRIRRGRAGEPDSPDRIGRYDVVVSRAVAPLGRLLEWCVPLVADQGHVAALKGRSVESEIESLTRRQRRLVEDLNILEIISPDGEQAARVLVARPHGAWSR
ncbi:16S rRNA (guanine(527)-N(7))-methyltransferase RsmG [Blastococcus sp. Marseille-P5729]|uniref:16S rRNA (guanine(527)-N(7))-methyltransferase RsmG n=1 Tax=Blastococcus sp. Marseille-P5729 TaxID=2086582 RepID=UPI000D0F636A|nr:16S rRNA (guanine(527)-N(7))-methyltransferase RsmG [Blastococcus sp. Marseille-P5729]